MSTEVEAHFLTRQELITKASRPGGISARDLQAEYPHCDAQAIYECLEGLTLNEGLLRPVAAPDESLMDLTRIRFRPTAVSS